MSFYMAIFGKGNYLFGKICEKCNNFYVKFYFQLAFIKNQTFITKNSRTQK